MLMRQMSLLGFVSSVGCVGPQSNPPAKFNSGELESSTDEPSRSSCAATLEKEQQCTSGCCSIDRERPNQPVASAVLAATKRI